MKIEIELSEKLYADLSRAAKNLKISRKQFVRRAIRKMAESNKIVEKDITASLNKFFEEHPEANIPWWEDRGWEGCYERYKLEQHGGTREF